MQKSLEKALNASNSVTLPNFGGFMKMGNSYMFNAFLKFNDGKFSKFLQENEKINEQEANVKIETFISEIQSSLDSTGSFSMGTIGRLVLTDGKIKLEKVEQATSKSVKKAPEKLKETAKIDVSVKKEAQKKPEPKKIKEIKPPVPKIEDPKEKEKKKGSVKKLSTDFTVKEAQEKINTLNDKQEIIDFTKGDTRKTIITALNLRLKSLNKITPTESLETELNILEATKVKKDTSKDEKETPIKEGSTKEVKKQVAKESDILKTVIEEEASQKEPKKPSEEEKSVKTEKNIEKIDKTVPPIEKKIEIPKPEVKSEKLSEEKTPKKDKQTKEEEDLVALTEGAIKLEKEAKGRKRNKIILWIAIICILSGGGVVGYLKQDIVLGWFDNTELIAENEEPKEEEVISEESNLEESEIIIYDEESQNISEEVVADTIIEVVQEISEEEQALSIDEEMVEQVIEEEIEPEEAVSIQSVKNGKYYVVVGSFSKEKNASNLVKSLKEEGFNNASIFQNGNLQSVTLGTFATSDEAKQILQKSGKEGWVKKPR